MNSHLKIFAVVAAMALLIPAGATAKPEDKPAKDEEHGKVHKPAKGEEHGSAQKPAKDEEHGSALDPAKDEEPKKAHKPGKAKTPKLKLATVNVKGTVKTNDGTTMTVVVTKASGHAKACKGATLTFDVSGARFHTADNDADGDMDAADVLVDHAVKVRAKVAKTKGKKSTCTLLEGVIAAKAVHNRTTPMVEDDSEEIEEETGEEDVVEDEEELEDEELVEV